MGRYHIVYRTLLTLGFAVVSVFIQEYSVYDSLLNAALFTLLLISYAFFFMCRSEKTFTLPGCEFMDGARRDVGGKGSALGVNDSSLTGCVIFECWVCCAWQCPVRKCLRWGPSLRKVLEDIFREAHPPLALINLPLVAFILRP